MRSIRGALTRPSSRPTTRFPLTSAIVGTVSTRKRSASSGCSFTSTCVTRRRARSLRARCATRLSIRRAGPEWAAPKKTSSGRESDFIATIFPCKRDPKPYAWKRVYTPSRALVLVVAAIAAAGGAGVGYAIGGWHEAVAGGAGGILGAVVISAFVGGALRRGGTRGGTAVLVALAVGYLEAVVLPALAARARRHGGERYAGLRSLARD